VLKDVDARTLRLCRESVRDSGRSERNLKEP
jgi:hypothetical protein